MTAMIITDLDDTLLRSDKTVSNYTVGILKRCRSAGIKIVFATARSTQAASRFLAECAPDGFIGYGGALVTAEGEILHRFDIPPDEANRLIKECLETPEITGIHAINESVALSNHPEPDMTHYRYTDFAHEQATGYLKISVTARDPAAVERIASHFPMCDMLRYSGEDLYRFANRDAVKWHAVQRIADHYGYDPGAVVAFGDDINDLEMIEKCGVGVAVSNAVHEVQEAAKYICASNDHDGVAKWIEQYVLCHHGKPARVPRP